nr:unnamed protein product [Callosobruchus analis]
MVKTLENTIKYTRAAQPSTSKNWRGGTTKERWKTKNKQEGTKYKIFRDQRVSLEERR